MELKCNENTFTLVSLHEDDSHVATPWRFLRSMPICTEEPKSCNIGSKIAQLMAGWDIKSISFVSFTKQTSMSMIKDLNPKAVWEQFDKILQIPRPSKKEEKMIEFLLEFGKQHKLETVKDEAGNILIRKPGVKGKENFPALVLQSHMDMVCEKNSTSTHDFENEPIKAFIDGEWIKADGTTLGADDGIGIAAQLALLASDSIQHGPIECLFTIDEETGLTGAFALSGDFLSGNTLLNLDSEDEGELFIGCAGGKDTVITFKFKKELLPDKFIAFKASVTGLAGGHSGDEIHKGLGNSNKIMARFLQEAASSFKLRLHEFDGGNLRNAIPREAFATFSIAPRHQDGLLAYFDDFVQKVSFELKIVEPKLSIQLEPCERPKYAVDKKTQRNLLASLIACPHGVITMSSRMPGLVETSTNLASVKFKGSKIIVTTSQRSDIESQKDYVGKMVKNVFELAGAKAKHTDGYPGWSPDPDSAIKNLTVQVYKELFAKEPLVRSIHAGLECGLFKEKYPEMDMVSFGPTLRNVHSPDEKINIETVSKFWDLLVGVVEKFGHK